MAQTKTSQNSLREMLLNNGNVIRSEIQPSAFRHVDKAESQAAAIAARRAEISIKPVVSGRTSSNTHE